MTAHFAARSHSYCASMSHAANIDRGILLHQCGPESIAVPHHVGFMMWFMRTPFEKHRRAILRRASPLQLKRLSSQQPSRSVFSSLDCQFVPQSAMGLYAGSMRGYREGYERGKEDERSNWRYGANKTAYVETAFIEKMFDNKTVFGAVLRVEKGKASYSDSNYQLLGRIIERITIRSIGEVFQEFIFDELNLRDTYTYQDTQDNTPVPFYYNSRELWLPKYIASITVEGGIVSTAPESMVFLKEFFGGRFFPKEKIEGLKRWNLILPPPSLFFYGIGLEKLWTPRIVSPLKPIKEILGFWGQTGSFAFHNPESDLYFTGTTNQINGDGHQTAGKAIFKIIKSVR
jgi:CubicO group peptidase (beta-lactamase class C family)